jgi:hypothetical protein
MPDDIEQTLEDIEALFAQTAGASPGQARIGGGR